MMRRRYPCDVPGCDHSRARHQRICGRCWNTLPREITFGIALAWRQNRKDDWRQWKRHAATARTGGRVPGVVGSRLAYQQIARLTGDHDRENAP